MPTVTLMAMIDTQVSPRNSVPAADGAESQFFDVSIFTTQRTSEAG